MVRNRKKVGKQLKKQFHTKIILLKSYGCTTEAVSILFMLVSSQTGLIHYYHKWLTLPHCCLLANLKLDFVLMSHNIFLYKVLNFCLAFPSQHIHENKVMRVVCRPPDQRLNLLELTQVLEMPAVVKAGSTVF